MKKLTIAAIAAAIVGGANAADKTKVYDYKASVKYVDFKSINDKANGGIVWVKTVKSTSLTGYLVTPDDCCCTDPEADGGMLPSVLLVVNKNAKKYNGTESYVKLLPANLLASYWSQKNVATSKSATLEAQGYLFAGYGDNQDEQQNPGDSNDLSPSYNFGEDDTAGTQYLFGQFNVIEDGKFVEAWLYASGFGKAQLTNTKAGPKNPCLEPTGDEDVCLINLAGSVIGGSWSCVPNGIMNDGTAAEGFFEKFLCQGWEVGQGSNVINPDGNDVIMYNVVTGTWSIKYNKKMTKFPTQKANILYVGEVLDGNFDIDTFDADGSGDPLIGAWKTKWYDGL